jgi:hypothetical protein
VRLSVAGIVAEIGTGLMCFKADKANGYILGAGHV